MTPIWVSSRQTVLHVLVGSPAIMKSNTAGMPTVVCTCRHAPLSEMLRTAQGIGCVPRRIFPDFKIRLRVAGVCRLSTSVSSLLPRAKRGRHLWRVASSCPAHLVKQPAFVLRIEAYNLTV